MARVRYIIVFLASFAALLWERLWRRLWAAAAATMFFAALALLGIPALLGPRGHLLLLAAFAVALALALRGKEPFRFPLRADVERRMERAGGLPHRPLQTLRDRPASELSEEARGLWQKHLQKTADTLRQLKVYRPHPAVAARDRWKLRYFALLFLIFALAAAQKQSFPRLMAALTPDMTVLTGRQDPATLDLWITPPEYTGMATVFLSTARQGKIAHDSTLSVPAGSILRLRLSGPRFAPRLAYAGRARALSSPAPRNFTLDMPLGESGTLRLRSGFFRELGTWQLGVAPDAPPDVSISKIEPTASALTKLTFRAADDHGIVKLTGIVAVDGKSEAFDIHPPANGDEATATADLAASPAAGMNALMWLEAVDGAGLRAQSAPVGFVLPERDFRNPLARRVAAVRKTLLRDDNPLSRRAAAEDLALMAENPAAYNGDIIVFLSLGSAARRLVYDGNPEAADSAARLLWEVAMKLEDGGLSLARRELDSALRKLSQALDDKNATKQQLQEALEAVQQEMREYMQSLAAGLQQRLAENTRMPVLSQTLAQQFMKSLDVNKMIEQMRRLSQAGSREDLRKMAEGLQESINNFDMDRFGEMQKRQAEALQALQNLENILHRQQALYDKTNQADDPADLKDQKQEQDGIRGMLGESLRKLAETGNPIPENYAAADKAMSLSATALGKAARAESLPQQKTALDNLQKGLDEAVRQMAEQMQLSLLSFGTPSQGSFGEGYDPLGRSLVDDGSVKLPTEQEQRRVQEIIRELRRRAGEPDREKAERDYIDRLLDHF